MEIKTIGIACDHAGYALKKFVIEYLESHNMPYKDYGTYSDVSCNYPEFAHALGEAITNGEVYPGIAICGSGEGMSMTLNKHKGHLPSPGNQLHGQLGMCQRKSFHRFGIYDDQTGLAGDGALWRCAGNQLLLHGFL